MDINHETALAIVVAYRYFKADPLMFQTLRGRPRYYAFRILKAHFMQVPASLLARYVGYLGHNSMVVAAPSQEKHYSFDQKILDRLYREFNEKLQKHARSPELTDDELSQKTQRRFAEINQAVSEAVHLPELPKLDNEQVRLPALSLRTKIEDLPRYVSTAIPVNNRRKTLEDELRQAILNTGGRLVK